jgi:hypothetical protein
MLAACSVFAREPHFAPPGMVSLDGQEVRALIVDKLMHYPDNSHITERFCPNGERIVFGTRVPIPTRYAIRGRSLSHPRQPNEFRQCFYRDAEGAIYIAGCDADSTGPPRRVEFSAADCPTQS